MVFNALSLASNLGTVVQFAHPQTNIKTTKPANKTSHRVRFDGVSLPSLFLLGGIDDFPTISR